MFLGVAACRISSYTAVQQRGCTQNLYAKGFGNLRLPEDSMVRTREVYYQGGAYDQVLSPEVLIVYPGRKRTFAI